MRHGIGPGVLALVLALGACKDMGVRAASDVPLAIARVHPPVMWAYQAVNLAPGQRKAYEGRTGDVFALGGQQFIVGYPEFAGARNLLVPVGTENGAAVYALRWDVPPFDRVYVAPDANRLQVAEPVNP